MRIDPKLQRALDARQRALGVRVRVLREERGEAQAATADAIGVHRTYLSRFENGKENVSLAVLYSIADHFGVSAASLLPD